MGYLTRRVEHLLKLREEGKLLIASSFGDDEAGRKLLSELDLIDHHPGGSIDLSTCSPMVRAVAKAAFAMEHYELIEDTINSSPEGDAVGSADASRAMTEYFQLLEEFFIAATGYTAEAFDFDEYRGKVLSRDPSVSMAARRAYEEYPTKIVKFHSHNSALLYRSARSLGGLKVVLGGSSRFPKAALDGVRKMALYADTILVPDPLLPWLEVNRVEERFPSIEFLMNTRQLLLLKPLVDAKLTFPAVLVFPSWEKSFELKDIEAKDGISHLILGFFSAYLNTTFEDESEIVEYVQGPGQAKFEETVTAKGLFWPPEETGPLPFAESVVKYQAWLVKQRSGEWLETMSSLSPHLLILNGIWERLTPHYHAWDNANAMRAQPMYWLSPHFHYYRLISSVSNLMVHQNTQISNLTFSSLESLLNPKASWLGNVPIRDLARLREENANEQFRARLHSYMDDLASAELQDLDSVSASVMRALESLLAEHDREAKRLADSLERKLTHILASSILTTAVAMYPWLESWLSLAILAPPLNAAYNLIEDARERKALSKSLVGVLSEAHSGTDNQHAA